MATSEDGDVVPACGSVLPGTNASESAAQIMSRGECVVLVGACDGAESSGTAAAARERTRRQILGLSDPSLAPSAAEEAEAAADVARARERVQQRSQTRVAIVS